MQKKSIDSNLYSADYYSERCGGVEFFRQYGYDVLKPSMQFAIQKARLAATDRILDIGCGRGELVAHLAEKGLDATGIDYSQDAIHCAKAVYPKGKFLLVRSDEPIFEDSSFDKIFLLGTVEHLYEFEIEKTFGEIKRLLKPGGLCVISTCTNALYYKTRTFAGRKAAVDFLAGIGIKFPSPHPPWSKEDEAMHINEKHYFSLRSSLKKLGWPFQIIPRPNNKLTSHEVYGDKIPADIPLRARPIWKQYFYRLLVFHFPLSLILARYYVAVVSAPKN